MSVLVTGAVLGYSGWLYISDNQIFYNYLFGAYGLYNYFWQDTVALSDWYRSFLHSSAMYYLIVGAAAICAGLIVFTLMQIGSVLRRGVTLLWRETHSQNGAHQGLVKYLLYRLGLRIITIAGWVVYSVFFVGTLVSIPIVGNQAGIELFRKGDWTGIFFCLGAFLFFCVILHMHIIFGRLVFLRPRIFGGGQAIEEAESHSRHKI